MVSFPDVRLRRLRELEPVRSLIRETRLSPSRFIYPLFVTHGQGVRQAIEPMPGCYHLSLDLLAEEVREVVNLGIPAVLLFGLPPEKDPVGTGAYDPEGIIQEAVRVIKKEAPHLLVITDVCLCEYTDHGHCGVVTPARGGVRGQGGGLVVDNDPTLDRYAAVAVAQARAGAHVIAPSGMMDGQVAAIRDALDDADHTDTAILAYAAKYASALYGPFRDAVDVTIVGGGDRRGYQQDPRNLREALLEVDEDVAEGADMVMVKPALAYLDVIAAVRHAVDVPVAAYHVSGEYAMVKAAAERGWVDGPAVALEHLTAVKRAGADIILTYFAREVAETLHG